MRTSFMKTIIVAATLLWLCGAATAASEQEKSSTANMEILRDKIRADRKLLVAENMELTESEAKAFWPIYEQYQNDLDKINQRIASLLDSYADDYRNKSMTDDKAKKLIDEALAIDKAEADMKSGYAPKFTKVLPARKVMRYLQVENKIRAVVRYELVSGVPLVK